MISPPVIVSITRIGSTGCDASILIALRATAPAAAPAVIVSIGTRDPRPPMTTLPASAPTTPPRLKAVMPALAVAGEKPALVSNAVSQPKPR